MARIVLLTLEYPPFKGGVAEYLGGLRNACDEAGHEFFVLAPRGVHGEASEAHIETPFFSKFIWPRWLLPAFRLAQRVRDIKPDYVMISHVLPVGLMAMIIKRLTGIPYISVVHGLDIAKPKGIKRWLIKHVLKRSALIICNSNNTKRIADSYNVGTDSQVVYPGIVPFDPIVSAREGYRILSVGRLVERNGFDTLICAMPNVLKKCPDAHLTIAGDGPQREDLEGLGDSLDLRESITFEGSAERDRLHALYSRSDLFCLLPREIDGDVEGFGIVFLEAAMHSLPAVAGGSGGVSEAVQHDVSGFVCDPTHSDSISDRIITLLSNESMSVQMGIDARERVLENFTWDVTAQPLLNWLQQEKVSVIIPVFNHADELEKCLESVFIQSYKNIEVIVVDDGSEIPIVNDDPRVKLIRQENKGAPAARNTGFRNSNGEYVIFCDADVAMKSDMLQRMMSALHSSDAAYAYSSFYFGFKKFAVSEFDASLLKNENYIHTTSLIRRSDFPGFDESLNRFQDWDLWLSMLEQNKKGVGISEVLFSVKPRKLGMSHWLPRFAYRFSKLPQVKSYNDAKQVINTKHSLHEA